ncbi:MAG: nucleotide exchange factor GrpE [Proteobacteria bacterium]|nr:nucleotide exchange factor GrpE [Pseudomonadota bacterium]
MTGRNKTKIDIKNDESGNSKGNTTDTGESENETDVNTADPLKELEEKVTNKELEAKQTYDRFLRVSAEFENYKKRSAREMIEFRKYANESLITELLTVVDNIERAISTSSSDDQANSCIIEGVSLTLKEILKVFDNFGVTPIESLCKTFDPNFHQAVMQEESEEHPDNTVIAELQKGYMIHDRLLRPSMVVVSKLKATPENNKKNT